MSQATATPAPHATMPRPATAAAPGLNRQRFLTKRWSIAEFDRLSSLGVFREGDSTFLWDGGIYSPTAEDPLHWVTREFLRDRLAARFPAIEFNANSGVPLNLAECYKPQPDLMVLQGPLLSWVARTPGPADVVLLIEVSNTSYEDDAGEMLREYAKPGIARYWIVNIPGRRIEAHLRPDREGGSYAESQSYGLDRSIPLVVEVDGRSRDFGAIEVREVLAHANATDAPPHA